MSLSKTEIFVYAHWQEMQEPKLIGILAAQQAKEKKAFSFNTIKTGLKQKKNFF